MELRKVINGSDAGTIGTFARIGWHQLPVRAVPAIGIFRALKIAFSFTSTLVDYSGQLAHALKRVQRMGIAV